MARLLVTGVSGLLGINLIQEALAVHEVTGVDRGKLASGSLKLIKADLLDEGAVNSTLDAASPDWLIHCAALPDLDACERDPMLASRLNTDLPAQLAKACRSRDISFAHISTDAVFGGVKDGFYTEEDETHPLSVYAQTKAESERLVLSENPNAIVARVNFYGWSLTGRRSLAEFFFHNLTNKQNVSGFTDIHFCPMLVNDTARLLLKMLNKGLSGLYHLVGPQAMSKYQFGVELARKFELDESLIAPKSVSDSGLIAQRSHNLCLSTHKLSTDLGEDLPDFSTGLNEFYTQYQQGYPQKIRSYLQR